jgi:L-ascorbate metabolism protein UlaG (beta-lactamase superfamily)
VKEDFMALKTFALALAAAGSLAGPARPQELQARFIGNAAFEITDGRFTLLSDFPYLPGYGGYMSFPREEIRPRKDALCLITHRHADHFDASAVGAVGCSVLGPADVLRQVPAGKALPADATAFGPLRIRSIPTAHSTEGHNSYLVEWAGLKLYFTGDTETLDALRSLPPVDILFITPWLMVQAREAKAVPKAARIVIYHHRTGERRGGDCARCVVPRQGEVLRLQTGRR